MILQPIVGNIFKHGFVFDHYDNLIRVEVKNVKNDIYISIYDNGSGIKQDILDKINEELSGSTLLKEDEGFGLYSVNRRIKTIYGEKYGVKVESLADQYTNVTICFPAKTEE